MHAILANTIWAPIFVYCYDWPSALISAAIGFVAEFGVFRLYTRSLLSPAVALRRLIVANVASYVAGFFLMAFVPFGIHKVSLAETALAFVIAYIITVPIEFYVMRSLLPANRSLLFRAVTMANFISYAILFTGYFLWFAGWRYLIRTWTGNA
jgi:hypothetical protein